MEEKSKHGEVGRAAMKAGMDRKTARRYLRSGKLPSELKLEKGERSYRTREDPFAEDWEAIREKLEEASALDGKALFEWLMEQHPGRYQPGQLRTLQRRVKQWRATEGPDKEVFFAQAHRPGEAMQPNQNGDVESSNNGLKRRLLQHLILRGSRDFESVNAYERWMRAPARRGRGALGRYGEGAGATWRNRGARDGALRSRPRGVRRAS